VCVAIYNFVGRNTILSKAVVAVPGWSLCSARTLRAGIGIKKEPSKCHIASILYQSTIIHVGSVFRIEPIFNSVVADPERVVFGAKMEKKRKP
jgi:hypothetical protein